MSQCSCRRMNRISRCQGQRISYQQLRNGWCGHCESVCTNQTPACFDPCMVYQTNCGCNHYPTVNPCLCANQNTNGTNNCGCNNQNTNTNPCGCKHNHNNENKCE